MKRFLLFALWMLAASSFSWGQAFTALVSKKQVPLDGTLQVSFRLDNAAGRNFQAPDFAGFQLLGGPSTSQSMEFINGVMRQSTTWTYVVRPSETGNKRIGSAKVEVEGKSLATEPITVEVTAAGSNPSASNAATPPSDPAEVSADVRKQIQDNFFVKTSVSDQDVSVGEQVTVTYKLFTRLNFNGFSPKPPSYQGFWTEELDPGSRQLQRENYNGQAFNATVFKKVVLFPQRAGKLTIDPMNIETGVQVMVPKSGNRTSVFDDFFNQYRTIDYTLVTDNITVNVRPLPDAGKPTGFNGAVGRYRLSASLDKEEAKTGDAITLHIEVSGEGNVKTLPDFDLNFPPDFEVYDPKMAESVSRDGGMLGGTKTFDFLLIPRNPGEYRLPDIVLAYFDPKSRQYEVKTVNLPVVKVTGAPLGAAASSPGKEDIKLLNQDIRYLAPVSRLYKHGYSFAGSVGFWLLYLLPVLGFVLFLGMQKRNADQQKDPVGQRRKKATLLAQKRLQQAKTLLDKQDKPAFYTEVSRAIWGYLSDKLSLNLADLSRAEVRKRLTDRKASDEMVSRLEALLDRSQMALYAPVAPGDMTDLLHDATSLIADFDETLE